MSSAFAEYDTTLPHVVVLEECSYCNGEFYGPALSFEEEVWMRGLDEAARFCSMRCAELSVEQTLLETR